MKNKYRIIITHRNEQFPFTLNFAKGFKNRVDAENYIRENVGKNLVQLEDGNFQTPHFIYKVIVDGEEEN